jgi:hypothetical protein
MPSTRAAVIAVALALAAGASAGCGEDEGTVAPGAEDADLPPPQFAEVAFEGALKRGDEKFGAGWTLTGAALSADVVSLDVAEGEELAGWIYHPLTGELGEGAFPPERRRRVEYAAGELDPAAARKIVARGLEGHPDYGLVNVNLEQRAGEKEPRWRATFHDESLENVSVWASAADGTELRQTADAKQIRAAADRRRAAEVVDELGGEAVFCRLYEKGLAAGEGKGSLFREFREGGELTAPPGPPSPRALFDELVSRC